MTAFTGRHEFITMLGSAAAGRSRRARSSLIGCGASACSRTWPQTIRIYRPAWPHLRRAAGIRLDRWPQRPDRIPLGSGQHRALSRLCSRADLAGA